MTNATLAKNIIGCCILAGGESRRMGQSKPLLALGDGQTLLEFHCSRAALLGIPVLLADNGKNLPTALGVQRISDYVASTGKGAGALSAICGAMHTLTAHTRDSDNADKNRYLLVISCDSLIGADRVIALLERNLAHTAQDDAQAYYLYGEKDYPLLGIYRMDLLDKLTNYLDNGGRSVMRFLSTINTETASLPTLWQPLANFNTPDEFAAARASQAFLDNL